MHERSPALSPQLTWLLESHLDTVEKLELVSHLRRTGTPAKREEVRTAMPTASETFDEALAELERAGFLDLANDEVRLGPRADHERRLGPLLDAYESDRASVMSALATLALKRIRQNALE